MITCILTVCFSQTVQNQPVQQYGAGHHGAPIQQQQQSYPGSQQHSHTSPGLQCRAGHQPTQAQAKSQAENIRQILTCGSIVASDLQQIDLLGNGNGGQVYK